MVQLKGSQSAAYVPKMAQAASVSGTRETWKRTGKHSGRDSREQKREQEIAQEAESKAADLAGS